MMTGCSFQLYSVNVICHTVGSYQKFYEFRNQMEVSTHTYYCRYKLNQTIPGLSLVKLEPIIKILRRLQLALIWETGTGES